MEILSSRVLLRPRDRERLIAFYGEVLGLPVYREFGAEEGRGVVFFLGGGFLEVSGEQGDAPTGATQLWLQVRDIHATHRYLVERGVPIDAPPRERPWGLVEMHARDPEGLTLVFVEVPPRHPLRRDLRGINP
jgi:predicted enzyme related to lactoylglutathione lyase